MSRFRYRTILGVVVFLVAVLALGSEAIAGLIPLPVTMLTVIGGLLLLIGAYTFQQWSGRKRQRNSPPVPETKKMAPVPGEEFDRKLTQLQAQYSSTSTNEVRQEIRQVAMWTLVSETALTADEASDRLERGEWTDDPHAAAFFASGYPDWTPRSVRLRMRLTTADQTFRLQARRAIQAVKQIHQGDAFEPKSPPERSYT